MGYFTFVTQLRFDAPFKKRFFWYGIFLENSERLYWLLDQGLQRYSQTHQESKLKQGGKISNLLRSQGYQKVILDNV